MDYTTVFDVAEVGYRQWSFAATGLIFVAAGIAMPFFITSGLMRESSPQKVKWFRRLFIGLAVLWTVASFFGTYLDYWAAVHVLRNGGAKVVEGPVEEYDAIPLKSESFVVQGVRFRVSDYHVTAGFNNMASKGGPIRPGLPVKIWYWHDEILRLQVRKEPNQAMQRTAGRSAFSFPMTSTLGPAATRALASGR